MLEIDFAEARLDSLAPESAVALLAFEDGERSPLFQAIETATKGALSRGLKASEFSFGRSKSVVLHGPGGGLSRVVVIGLGRAADIDARAAEAAGSVAARPLTRP